MQENIEDILRAEEKAIVVLQNETYPTSQPRKEFQLKHACDSYVFLLKKYFPEKPAAQKAHEDTTKRLAQIEKHQQTLEEQIRNQRFKLKSTSENTSRKISQPFLTPEKNEQFSQPSLKPQKKTATFRLETKDGLLSHLEERFNTCIEEKRRLKFRAARLASQLKLGKKKLTPYTTSGRGLWKKSPEEAETSSTQTTEGQKRLKVA